ncbi:MAG: DEAD/DEAH box helicase [Proteobacteria bacterium]|nr:DEAD/DEAH box helicase [Pseudomonadota bacterium]
MRNRPFRRTPEYQGKRPKLKAEADKRLKRVFEIIGMPEPAPFIPDPFQVEAVDAARRSDCLVTAPTGSGKTWIAEQAISQVLEKGGRSWYASPLKALSNAKHLEFSDIFGPEKVGILTGDRKENSEAAIVVGTTEVLRNQLYDAMHLGVTLPFDFVVLDEAHFLGDVDRGVVWEEIIIYLPARIPLLLLSATIGNADAISRWISSTRRKECVVIKETHRPVPLFPMFLHPSGTLYPLMMGRETGPDSKPDDKTPKSRMDKKVSDYLLNKRSVFFVRPGELPPFGEILGLLRKFNLLPAIFFLKSRADCDRALDLCKDNEILPSERKEKLNLRIEELSQKRDHVSNHRHMASLKNNAVGAHHSGHLPVWKLILEQLMTEGCLDAIFATSTVAAGVNFPARSIVILNSDRFNGHEFMPLDPTEFHQMAGRAGRRGKDNIGFAIILPGKFMDIRHVAKLTVLPPTDIQSQIRINFSMVLNLLLSHSPDQIKDLLSKSFASFQLIQKKGPEKGVVGTEIFVKDFYRHLEFLRENGFVSSSGELTEDGLWASKLRVDEPLMIAEGLRKGVFPSDPALFAATVCAFVNEDETDDRVDSAFLPNRLKKIHGRLVKQLAPFSNRMRQEGFSTKPQYLRPMATLYAWATGYSWEKVHYVSNLGEGDLAMLILRTAENLRHMTGLKEHFPDIAQAAESAVELILKEPVVFD